MYTLFCKHLRVRYCQSNFCVNLRSAQLLTSFLKLENMYVQAFFWPLCNVHAVNYIRAAVILRTEMTCGVHNTLEQTRY